MTQLEKKVIWNDQVCSFHAGPLGGGVIGE